MYEKGIRPFFEHYGVDKVMDEQIYNEMVRRMSEFLSKAYDYGYEAGYDMGYNDGIRAFRDFDDDMK